jgi:hypothetical protein
MTSLRLLPSYFSRFTSYVFHDRLLWLTLALTIFAWAPLLSPGYFFQAHDARHSVFFLVEFDAALRDGAWWPRWGMDHAFGYGYPLWIFYSPLSYYVAEIFYLLGMGFTAAVKATYLVGFLVAAWAMYALVSRWWGRPAGLVAALAYTYAPYHLADIYVRSAFAECMAFVWYPLALLAFDRLLEQGGRRRLALAALAYAGLTLTHTVTALVFTPLLAAYVLWSLARCYRQDVRASLGMTGSRKPEAGSRRPSRATTVQPPTSDLRPPISGFRLPAPNLLSRALQALTAALLGLGVSAIFLVPMILERPSIIQAQWVQDTYQYQRHFVYPHQFLAPLWGFGYSVEGPGDGMSFQLGAVTAILALAATIGALQRPMRRREHVLFMACATSMLLLGMTALAGPVWRVLPLAQLVQFPWRALAPTAVTLAVLAGAAVGVLPAEVNRQAAAGSLGLLLVVTSLPYVTPQFTPITAEDESSLAIVRFETEHPDMVGMTAWTSVQPTDSPLLAQYREGKPLQRLTIIQGQGQVETTRVGGASVQGHVQAEGPTVVQFLTYWFPGWQARVDGAPVASRPQGEYGLLTIDVPAGEHRVSIRMEGTPARRVGTAVSGVCLLVVATLALASQRRKWL